MVMPSFSSLGMLRCLLISEAAVLVDCARTDVAGDGPAEAMEKAGVEAFTTPFVVMGWALEVVPSITTSVGNVRLASCVIVVEG